MGEDARKVVKHAPTPDQAPVSALRVRVRTLRYITGGIYGYSFICPGCGKEKRVDLARWMFSGTVQRPTFRPSLLWNSSNSAAHATPPVTCHAWVTEGRIEFLSDSTHGMAGKTVDLPLCSDGEA